MLAAAINEAAFMIEEGICDRPQDMDLAMIYGTGFPPYRGGILRYADQWGAEERPSQAAGARAALRRALHARRADPRTWRRAGKPLHGVSSVGSAAER
ncbi:MAG: hypothetical protein MZU95_00310 [Desulfomicrobium escambiense]|nr:hypothetical protein [Desulfomicrobium escambiense]